MEIASTPVIAALPDAKACRTRTIGTPARNLEPGTGGRTFAAAVERTGARGSHRSGSSANITR